MDEVRKLIALKNKLEIQRQVVSKYFNIGIDVKLERLNLKYINKRWYLKEDTHHIPILLIYDLKKDNEEYRIEDIHIIDFTDIDNLSFETKDKKYVGYYISFSENTEEEMYNFIILDQNNKSKKVLDAFMNSSEKDVW